MGDAPLHASVGCGEGGNRIGPGAPVNGWLYWYSPRPWAGYREGSVSLLAGEGYAGVCRYEIGLGAC